MAIDSHYIPAFSIEEVLLDKDTGAPLSGGIVTFERSLQPGTLKAVYQITGTDPDFSYISLPNPMTLSSIGTFEDSLGNPVVPYFLPYDTEFNPDYYRVIVESSEEVPQFVRDPVPYIPSSGSDEVLSIITNEMSNPQFAEVLFDTSSGDYTYTFGTVSQEVVSIAPDWDLIVTCPTSGTVTVSQITPQGSLNILTNPGTILNIASAGISALLLRQRIYGSPNLWGDGYLSASFVAKTYSGTDITLEMFYSQSNGLVVDQLLVSATLPSSGEYGSYPDSALIPISTSTEEFPDAYIDIYFDIPLSVEIDITSVMLSFTGATSIDNIEYDQESLNRQIDHLYHYAYPIVPIGTIIDFSGFGTPLHFYLCDGSAKSRISDNLLFQAITKVESVTLTSTVTTFTVVTSAEYFPGMAIEGTGIPAATTIASISGNTVTMSAAATATGASSVRFFKAGAGDGSTTFNLPQLSDFVTAGSGGTIFSAANNAAGRTGGGKTVSIDANNLPAHKHGPLSPTTSIIGGGGTGSALSGVGTFQGVSTTGDNTTTHTALSIVQQTVLMNKCIRYQ